ncbi:Carcinoembryonic antigen-related cell adhesion molecule 21 [Myotis davidii]|uniref:Carcinoembryonic antigen-related cell adhesion molecule 21 n=1 Tax=Myotis davidii TaxID=225400 RepID=L5LG24_MYODS|nr:Carcinoembryonic antigen-related cell adhesion molecule 21 [Myotis davidii]
MPGSLTLPRALLSEEEAVVTMEPLEASAPRGRVLWLGLLLAERVSVPTLLASNTTVTENEDAVVMTCYTDATSTNWLFNATRLRLRERMKLSQDHRTLTIDPVRREDAGNYQCKVSNPVSSTESVPVELDVKY